MKTRVGFVALGGHITTQDITFSTIVKNLGTEEYEFVGLEDGFFAFDTGNTHVLGLESFVDGYGRIVPGFVSGASRYRLTDKKTGLPLEEQVEKAIRFVVIAKLNHIVGSGGDEHGRELYILSQELKRRDIPCKVLVSNKTMDGDIGGRDGEIIDGYVAPFTDTSNGYVAGVALISNNIIQAIPDGWTNNVPIIITHFSEKSNFVGYGAAWYGLADLVFPGELPEEDPGWSLRLVNDRIRAAQADNLRKYGRKFAVVVVPESAKIEGVKHVSEKLMDAHMKRKPHPELLAIALKELLKEKYHLDVHTLTYTYELRTHTMPDFPYSLETDFGIAKRNGEVLADAIRRGESDLETTIKIRDGKVEVGLAPIRLVTQKRLTSYSQYPWFNPDTFTVRPEFGRYYDPLFGGGRVERERFLPRKPTVVNVFDAKA